MFRGDESEVMGQVSSDWLVRCCEPLSRKCRDRDGSESWRMCVGTGAVIRASLLAGCGLVALIGFARAADMPVKAPPPSVPSAYDWTGFYLGGHFGYAGGSSRWSATSPGAPVATGSIDFFNSFDAFNGSGSYAERFQAGYNYMLPSRWLVGVEADVSFPNTVGGTATVASPIAGLASYAEQVEFSSTLRGRVGYAPNSGTGHWLLYATGGLAWSYDQFSRTQIAGGGLPAGTVENSFMTPRVGGAVGAGVEYALPGNWTARLEYLFVNYGNRSVTFPASGQRFDSDLTLNEVRLGLNYRLGADAKSSGNQSSGNQPSDNKADSPALETDNFAVHGQTTFLEQYAFPFRNPYSGTNSFIPNVGRETADATAYVGLRPWQGGEIWIDPEIDQGFGLSNTLGVAGFTSGEAYKVGASVPYARVPRYFLRQTIDLGGDSQKVDGGLNQFSGSQTANRLVITVGKFSVTDVFDNNKYAHDPRNDFMNWSLADTGTFDYAADAWGFSYGAAAEWYQGDWTVRGGIFDLSNVPNSPDLDPSFNQFQWIGEIERRYELWGQPGKIAVTGFLSRGRMGSYTDALALGAATATIPSTAAVRQYTSRGGVSINIEQQITEQLGAFLRAGWANGNLEPYEFTDIDRTVAAGLSLNGKSWGRPDDTVAIAGVVNGISGNHQAYFAAGGLGILIGDGMLPNPGLEQIVEAYYSYALTSAVKLTADYQFIANPAYNTDRGPANVISGRFHYQF
jgi:high affinity Mn2+ porin